MDEPDFKNLRVAVVGLGLMGGSMAMALRGYVGEIVGCDTDSAAITFALKNSIIHRAAKNFGDAAKCNLIILATPPRVILQQLRELQTNNRQLSTAIVIDLGSTKKNIVAEMKKLPAHFDPLGGHPMCGKEFGGITHAQGDLFNGKTFILSPLERTSIRAMKIAHQLIEAIGAVPLTLAPERHDQCVALISHLPYIVSTALVQTVMDNTDALTLASSGFRDTTRLAASDLTMMTDILTTNRDEVLEAISRYRAELDSLAALVTTADPEKIRHTLSSTQAQRREMFK